MLAKPDLAKISEISGVVPESLFLVFKRQNSVVFLLFYEKKLKPPARALIICILGLFFARTEN